MTIGAISKILGLSKSTVHRYVKALEERGWIVRGPDGYPEAALPLVRRLYSLVRETGSLQEALDALVQEGSSETSEDCRRLREELERLRSFVEGFASALLKRLEEIERSIEELKGPKGLPAPKPWWKRLFQR